MVLANIEFTERRHKYCESGVIMTASALTSCMIKFVDPPSDAEGKLVCALWWQLTDTNRCSWLIAEWSLFHIQGYWSQTPACLLVIAQTTKIPHYNVWDPGVVNAKLAETLSFHLQVGTSPLSVSNTVDTRFVMQGSQSLGFTIIGCLPTGGLQFPHQVIRATLYWAFIMWQVLYSSLLYFIWQ